MKIISYILAATLFGSFSYAQHSGSNSGNDHNPGLSSITVLQRNANRLINNNFQDLSRQDKVKIRKSLRGIINIIEDSVRTPIVEYVCDSRRDELIKIEHRFRTVIYDFLNATNCRSAKESVESGFYFCDNRTSSLFTQEGAFVHDFRHTPDCRIARRRAARGQNFCDDNAMYNSRGNFLKSFASARSCQNRL